MLTIQFNYTYAFSFGKVVIARLLRLFIFTFNIRKYQCKHIRAKKDLCTHDFVMDFCWKRKLNNRRFWCFNLSNQHKDLNEISAHSPVFEFF